MLMKKLALIVTLFLVSVGLASAQTTVNGDQTYVAGAWIATQVANAGSTGTTVNKIAKLTSGTAVIAATTDAANGVWDIGIVAAGAGTTGSASIATFGQVPLVFDGATTAGDFVIASTTTAGDGHDAGATLPAVQNFGIVLSTNGGAGTYTVFVFPHQGPTVVFEGTQALGTGAISAGACASTTTTAAGVLTSDAIKATPTADLTGITGYVPSSVGAVLSIYPPYSTGGNIIVKVCNNTGSTITPSAVTLNLQVLR